MGAGSQRHYLERHILLAGYLRQPFKLRSHHRQATHASVEDTLFHDEPEIQLFKALLSFGPCGDFALNIFGLRLTTERAKYRFRVGFCLQ